MIKGSTLVSKIFRIIEILYFISYLLVITEGDFHCELLSSQHYYLLSFVMILVKRDISYTKPRNIKF